MIGTSLKGYQILDKIKDGSVGTVWRARNQTGRLYALKILKLRHVKRAIKLKRFKREATLTQKLEHPNIITVYEYVQAKPQPFYTMEYFRSENLKHTLTNLPEVLQDREFHILRQVAEALAYLHSRNIIHRDVKPENILVSADADIRLIDFSLAQTKTDRVLRFGKRIEGTPLYMSPEQIRGEKCDHRTDIYSFGAVMFELLTKTPPFMGANERRIFEMHLRDPVPPMNTRVQTISSDLSDFVRKMLAKRPENRYQNMTTIIYELYKWERKDRTIRLRQVEPGKPKAPQPGT